LTVDALAHAALERGLGAGQVGEVLGRQMVREFDRVEHRHVGAGTQEGRHHVGGISDDGKAGAALPDLIGWHRVERPREKGVV
jgi:hypothetical protein